MLKKIAIKNILPNPYRGINKYPIDKEKVNELIESYQKTGMWIGIVGRPHNNNGKVEISFGHHRLEAAKKLGYKEIDVDVRKIGDADMIKMMADENMDRKINSAVINQTVMSAKEYMDNSLKHGKFEFTMLFKEKEYLERAKRHGVGEKSLVQFLGKSWQRNINIALRTLNESEKGLIDIKAVEVFEKPAHADTIREKFKEHKVPKSKQKEIAKKIKQKIESEVSTKDKQQKKKGEISSQRIKDEIDDEFFGATYKVKREKKKPDINKMLDEYTQKLRQINLSLDEVIESIEFSDIRNRQLFMHEIKELLKKLTKGGKKCKQLKLTK